MKRQRKVCVKTIDCRWIRIQFCTITRQPQKSDHQSTPVRILIKNSCGTLWFSKHVEQTNESFYHYFLEYFNNCVYSRNRWRVLLFIITSHNLVMAEDKFFCILLSTLIWQLKDYPLQPINNFFAGSIFLLLIDGWVSNFLRARENVSRVWNLIVQQLKLHL